MCMFVPYDVRGQLVLISLHSTVLRSQPHSVVIVTRTLGYNLCPHAFQVSITDTPGNIKGKFNSIMFYTSDIFAFEVLLSSACCLNYHEESNPFHVVKPALRTLQVYSNNRSS